MSSVSFGHPDSHLAFSALDLEIFSPSGSSQRSVSLSHPRKKYLSLLGTCKDGPVGRADLWFPGGRARVGLGRPGSHGAAQQAAQ